MRIVTNKISSNDGIKCPICGCENTHIIGNRANDSRYSNLYGNVVISIQAECDHIFEIVVVEHKGIVSIETAISKNDEDEYLTYRSELFEKGKSFIDAGM